MKPLSALDARDVGAVLLDIDDTLTTEGKLTASAYAALEALHAAGLRVVPVTGRPAGWCDHIARMWPVDAVVGENGAFYFWHGDGKLHRRYHHDEATRERNLARLRAIAADIVRLVPGSAIAADQAYRETDLAIDYCEDVPALPLAEAERIDEHMRAAGLTAKVSSIHVNGWFGGYDKLGMTKVLFAERFGMELDAGSQAVVFAGDSPNDAPMFRYFDRSVGVANVQRFSATLEHAPKYVTLRPAGAGFAELAAHLLHRR
jgi:HAD superfamily hydrolase (TIGR01484 family)